ncbi:rhomboid family protein [Flammeovirgaceae bacterium 311]|nr:rhomboid family protein [Flammeovirgaceae bacterium 311]
MNSFFEELKYAFKRPNNGLYRILLINIAIYLVLAIFSVIAYLAGSDVFWSVMQWISVPSEFEELIRKPWTLFTYMFVHEDFFHILFNMLFLYWFGQLVIEYLGSKRFVNTYVLGGLAGAVFFLIFYNILPPFQGRTGFLYGASAGVSAIVLAAATLAPNHSFFLLFLGPVKIKYIALIFIVLKSFLGLKGGNAGGELAHLGGAAIGYLYIMQLKNGRDFGAWISNSFSWIAGLFDRKPHIKVSHRREKAYTASRTTHKAQQQQQPKSFGKATQEEIDAILDKISAHGYESLSKEEKQKLFNASKKN